MASWHPGRRAHVSQQVSLRPHFRPLEEVFCSTHRVQHLLRFCREATTLSTADGDISCTSTGSATASRTLHSRNANLSAMKAGLTIRLSRSACLPPSHLQGARIERLSASTRGAVRRLSTPCKIPPDDHRVRVRRVSTPAMQRSSTSSSQNVHTQQPFFASRRKRAMAQRRQGIPFVSIWRKLRPNLQRWQQEETLSTDSGNAEERWRLQGLQGEACQVRGRIEGNASGRRGPRGRKS